MDLQVDVADRDLAFHAFLAPCTSCTSRQVCKRCIMNQSTDSRAWVISSVQFATLQLFVSQVDHKRLLLFSLGARYSQQVL